MGVPDIRRHNNPTQKFLSILNLLAENLGWFSYMLVTSRSPTSIIGDNDFDDIFMSPKSSFVSPNRRKPTKEKKPIKLNSFSIGNIGKFDPNLTLNDL